MRYRYCAFCDEEVRGKKTCKVNCIITNSLSLNSESIDREAKCWSKNIIGPMLEQCRGTAWLQTNQNSETSNESKQWDFKRIKTMRLQTNQNNETSNELKQWDFKRIKTVRLQTNQNNETSNESKQ